MAEDSLDGPDNLRGGGGEPLLHPLFALAQRVPGGHRSIVVAQPHTLLRVQLPAGQQEVQRFGVSDEADQCSAPTEARAQAHLHTVTNI